MEITWTHPHSALGWALNTISGGLWILCVVLFVRRARRESISPAWVVATIVALLPTLMTVNDIYVPIGPVIWLVANYQHSRAQRSKDESAPSG